LITQTGMVSGSSFISERWGIVICMAQDWLPRELKMTSKWTELVEYCDWDEEAAALLIEQIRHGLPPHPPKKISDLVKSLIMIAEQLEKQDSVKIAEA
jgi:hypothetical protein